MTDLIQTLTRLVLASKKTLTVEECADYIGRDKKTVQNMVSKNEIPYYRNKINNCTYFDTSEIDSWCKSRRVDTQDEARLKANIHPVITRKKLLSR